MEGRKISRRKFLTMMAGASSAMALSGCASVEHHAGMGWMPNQYRA